MHLAVDNGPVGSRRTSTATLTVNVTDMNDNAPMFQTTPTPRSLSEDVSMGTSVANLPAMDSDSGSNGQVLIVLCTFIIVY